MLRRLKRAMQIRQLVAGAAGLLFGVLLNVWSEWIADNELWVTIILITLCVAAFGLSIWFWWRNPSRVGLSVAPIKTLRSDVEKERNARRGLVTFVSLYRPARGSKASGLRPEEWQAAAAKCDYETLDLAKSNLATTIEAIVTHASRLEHCWLIGTSATTPDKPGSNLYIPALVEYLRARGVKCQFHYGPEYCVSLDDDALVFTKTLDLMRSLFKEADKYQLDPSDVVADFTSGVRSMTLGMILASLDGDRDIEMMGTGYGPDGEWTGPLFPIIFGFEPVLHEG